VWKRLCQFDCYVLRICLLRIDNRNERRLKIDFRIYRDLKYFLFANQKIEHYNSFVVIISATRHKFSIWSNDQIKTLKRTFFISGLFAVCGEVLDSLSGARCLITPTRKRFFYSRERSLYDE
jgi:hypothetical protein